MGDSGPVTIKGHESSRRSSTQRMRPAPRGRKSTQSLHSNGRPAEATFTSFEPFNSSPHGSGSDCSLSSSKRSRSVFAPERKHSVAEDDEPSPVFRSMARQNPKLNLGPRSLMGAMMDTEVENPLFQEPDLQPYRNHPTALERADPKVLQQLVQRYTSLAMIRTLAGDLAAKDAEMTALRKKNEALAALFKDHLCQVHGQSRLEADRTLHTLVLGAAVPEQPMPSLLEEATSTLIEDPTQPASTELSDPFDDAYKFDDSTPDTLKGLSKVTRAKSISPEPEPPKTIRRSMFGLFNSKSSTGSTTIKASSSTGRKLSRAPLTSQHLAEHTRRSSAANAPQQSSSAPIPPGPVEMNAIVEAKNCPPPLNTAQVLESLYPNFRVDVYGFIIDASRIAEYINKRRPTSSSQRRGVDTPITSASSIKSDVLSSGSDDEEEGDRASGQEQPPWTSYLSFDKSSLGSLSWLPIAAILPANEDQISDSPMELGQEDAAIRLQKQLEDDYQALQKSRTLLWEKFMASDKSDKESGGWTDIFRMSTQSSSRAARLSNTESGTVSRETRLERTRLILGGIPMQLRAKIWSQCSSEISLHEPDEYDLLVARSFRAVDRSSLSEINDDIPRTLANNVFFRSGTGRAGLSDLLRAFVTRRPEIGYCQGMNLIGGYLLLALPSQETAFWVFDYMIGHVLAETYFDATMRGASIEIAVLRSYVRDLIPRLARHLDDLDIADQESVPYNWFLTAFASTLPIEALYRVWDVVLALPTQKNFLLRCAIALLKVNEDKLLAIYDSFVLRDFLDRGLAAKENAVGIDGLIKASSTLGKVVKDDEVKKRRKHFALRIDRSALG